MKIWSYKTLGMLVLVFILTFSVGALIGWYLNGDFGNSSIENTAERGKPVNILLMGIDARGIEENSRSDTMILVSIDPKNKKIAMVWIPRDTRVKVSVRQYNKINSVNYLKGQEAACDQVSDLLGSPVDYYMVTNFDGFAEIVDILGGVTINVEGEMQHGDPNPKLNINLHKGVQKLNGADSLRYVRYRGGPTADIGRTGRQQKFVKALVAEMFKTKTIIKLTRLVPEIAKNIRTNIPMTDMLYMVKLARDFDNLSIATQTLPGCPYNEPGSGASYWLADEKLADGIIDRMFNGEKFPVAQDPPSWVKQQRQAAPAGETKTDKNGDADAPMAEDATLEDDFTGQDIVNLGDKPVDNTFTDQNNKSGKNNTNPQTPGSQQNPTTLPEQNPPATANPDNGLEPQNGAQAPGSGSAGY